jgi:adenylate cyclase class 2
MNLGFKEKIRKRKIGSTYDYEGITAELTEVEGLGWFIELEILLPERDNEKIENVRERLLCLLDLLEVSRSKIESRSYSSMLAEIRSDSTILADY